MFGKRNGCGARWSAAGHAPSSARLAAWGGTRNVVGVPRGLKAPVASDIMSPPRPAPLPTRCRDAPPPTRFRPPLPRSDIFPGGCARDSAVATFLAFPMSVAPASSLLCWTPGLLTLLFFHSEIPPLEQGTRPRPEPSLLRASLCYRWDPTPPLLLVPPHSWLSVATPRARGRHRAVAPP
jgi:hypothetical protein